MSNPAKAGRNRMVLCKEGPMTTIKATCHACGDITLTTDDIVVFDNGPLAEDYQFQLRFDCNDCGKTTITDCRARAVHQLIDAGVAIEPAPITEAEVDGFVSRLTDDALERAVAGWTSELRD